MTSTNKAHQTTLIVTPPSLAAQWVDEINAHAPSLNIFVYDGWSKLAIPIIKSAEEKARVLKLLKRGKALQSASTRKRKAPTTQEGSRKKKNKETNVVNTNDVEMDVDEDEVESMMDWCNYVQQYDVVITTYNVLRTDLNIARAALRRPRREDVTYANIERPRSPLVTVEWLRVIMDEVQMAGGGKAESVHSLSVRLVGVLTFGRDMVSLIPRLASFAVSGTPARSRVSDLSHVLKFVLIFSLSSIPFNYEYQILTC
jgi:E3 ubiquitin-protein ligase SHPRH